MAFSIPTGQWLLHFLFPTPQLFLSGSIYCHQPVSISPLYIGYGLLSFLVHRPLDHEKPYLGHSLTWQRSRDQWLSAWYCNGMTLGRSWEKSELNVSGRGRCESLEVGQIIIDCDNNAPQWITHVLMDMFLGSLTFLHFLSKRGVCFPTFWI